MQTNVFNNTQKFVGNGTIDLETDTFKIILVNDYTFVGAHSVYADVSAAEILGGYDYYTPGGYTLTGTALTVTGDKTVLSADAVNSPTSSGDNTVEFNGLILMSSTADKLMIYIDLEQTYTINDSDFVYIAFGADGVYTLEVP